MGISYNASIVRNGLILHLDAANRKSYPGSGTAWNDLSGNGNHFTLVNSPVYDGQYITFDGANSYAMSASMLNLSGYDDITVEIGLKVNTAVTPMGMAFEHSSNWNTNSMGFGLVPNSSGSTTYVSNSHHTNQYLGAGVLNYTGIIGTTLNMHTNIWSRLAGTQRRKAYINTILNGAKDTSAYPAFRNDFFYISSRGGVSLFANHSVSFVRIYGKALSENEIKQNFNALRGRYGI
jgi:hypothetical protein